MLPVLASALAGGGAASVAYWVVSALRTEDLHQADEWRYDVSRINELRRVDSFYRLFQPIIRGLTPFQSPRLCR